MIEGARGRAWRAYADARRRLTRAGSAHPARAAFGRHRWDGGAWRRVTAERHAEYRRRNPPATGTLAIVCVTRRPHLLAELVANAARQDVDNAELIVVTNDPGYDDLNVAAAVAPFPGVGRVLRRDPSSSLGACLNAALDATDARFVAKFDDDDRYGRAYLSDALRAHGYAGAGVVGKHTYYAHLATSDETVLRFPHQEFRYSSTLAGGTLVIDRDRTGALRFEDRSLGEDRAFIAACHRAGVSTFSADRFNFTQVRSDDNEWQIERARFLEGSELLGPGERRNEIER